jgi:predicted RNA-binding protein YlqC (UPF0109 family)
MLECVLETSWLEIQIGSQDEIKLLGREMRTIKIVWQAIAGWVGGLARPAAVV